MVGLFEGKGAAWNPKQIPNDFSFGEVCFSCVKQFKMKVL